MNVDHYRGSFFSSTQGHSLLVTLPFSIRSCIICCYIADQAVEYVQGTFHVSVLSAVGLWWSGEICDIKRSDDESFGASF